jgi:hypothetical protein
VICSLFNDARSSSDETASRFARYCGGKAKLFLPPSSPPPTCMVRWLHFHNQLIFSYTKQKSKKKKSFGNFICFRPQGENFGRHLLIWAQRELSTWISGPSSLPVESQKGGGGTRDPRINILICLPERTFCSMNIKISISLQNRHMPTWNELKWRHSTDWRKYFSVPFAAVGLWSPVTVHIQDVGHFASQDRSLPTYLQQRKNIASVKSTSLKQNG